MEAPIDGDHAECVDAVEIRIGRVDIGAVGVDLDRSLPGSAHQSVDDLVSVSVHGTDRSVDRTGDQTADLHRRHGGRLVEERAAQIPERFCQFDFALFADRQRVDPGLRAVRPGVDGVGDDVTPGAPERQPRRGRHGLGGGFVRGRRRLHRGRRCESDVLLDRVIAISCRCERGFEDLLSGGAWRVAAGGERFDLLGDAARPGAIVLDGAAVLVSAGAVVLAGAIVLVGVALVGDVVVEGVAVVERCGVRGVLGIVVCVINVGVIGVIGVRLCRLGVIPGRLGRVAALRYRRLRTAVCGRRRGVGSQQREPQQGRTQTGRRRTQLQPLPHREVFCPAPRRWAPRIPAITACQRHNFPPRQ